MEYAQLNTSLTEALQVTTNGNILWDDTHFCPASALTNGEADLFRVVPLEFVAQPPFNSATQRSFRAGCEKVNGAWRYAWTTQALSAEEIAALFAASIKAALLKIDTDTDAIYGDVLGNRAEEYMSAADDAAAYKAAGYTGAVPAGVQSLATAKSWTATKAADDILATSATWVTAQNGIRATRLARKEQVRVATDATSVSTVMTSWAGFVVYLRGKLGLL